MLRKTLLTTGILIACTTSSYASFANGLYIGLGLGPDYAKFQQNSSVVQRNNNILEFNVKNTTQLAGTGIYGTVFAGYGRLFAYPRFSCHCNNYLALELNADLSNLEYKGVNDEFVHRNFATTKFKLLHSYGVSIIPGYLLANSVLFYGRLGYSNGNFKISTSDTSLENAHENLDGFRWGFGAQHMLTPCIALRVDWSHVNYEQIKLSTLDRGSNTSKITHVTPQTNEVEFSLIYRFA